MGTLSTTETFAKGGEMASSVVQTFAENGEIASSTTQTFVENGDKVASSLYETFAENGETTSSLAKTFAENGEMASSLGKTVAENGEMASSLGKTVAENGDMTTTLTTFAENGETASSVVQSFAESGEMASSVSQTFLENGDVVTSSTQIFAENGDVVSNVIRTFDSLGEPLGSIVENADNIDAAGNIIEAVSGTVEAMAPMAEAIGQNADVIGAVAEGAAEGGFNCSNPIGWGLMLARAGGWVGYRLVKRCYRLNANMKWDRDGKRFGWKRTLREHSKLYPYYYEKYRGCFKPTLTDGRTTKHNPLFLTAEVQNGKSGMGRYDTQDSHFDKVGSVRRSFYIPNGTRVQVLCKEEMLTFQHCLRPGKLAIAGKFTVVWNNRYKYIGRNKDVDGHKLNNGDIVTLVKFGKKYKKCWYKKLGRFLSKPFKWLWLGARELLKPIVKGLRRDKERHWHVSKVYKDGKVDKFMFTARKSVLKEKDELEHVGNNFAENFTEVRDSSTNWENFEMLGNVNKVNLTDLRAGNHTIQETDVPAYGEIYNHCARGTGSRCTNRLSVYDCNCCKDLKTIDDWVTKQILKRDERGSSQVLAAYISG